MFGPPLALHWRSTLQQLRSLNGARRLQLTFRPNRLKSSRQYWLRLRPLRHQKIFRSRSLLLRQTFNRNSSKKEHRHRGSHRTRKNSRQSKPLGRCRCLEQKRSPRHVTGSGVIVAQVDAASGNVTSASVSQSTGSPILDNAATSAFRQWRFRPGTVSKVNIPITFTMTGASY
ncbi:MAG: hypothetical protein DMF02_03275 [Verrucomicrobia bacterium]|nr:MAG: hypothetical protein DMF02_03275 [Verrucomicrobiota bacterium]